MSSIHFIEEFEILPSDEEDAGPKLKFWKPSKQIYACRIEDF